MKINISWREVLGRCGNPDKFTQWGRSNIRNFRTWLSCMGSIAYDKENKIEFEKLSKKEQELEHKKEENYLKELDQAMDYLESSQEAVRYARGKTPDFTRYGKNLIAQNYGLSKLEERRGPLHKIKNLERLDAVINVPLNKIVHIRTTEPPKPKRVTKTRTNPYIWDNKLERWILPKP